MHKKPIPPYRKQKRPNGKHAAFIEVDHQRHYLGVWNTPESRERYARLVAELATSNGQLRVPSAEITVGELFAAFWQFAEGYYTKPNAETTSEVELFRLAMRPAQALYGRTRAAEFGPKSLKAVRQRMIDLGWSRVYINKQIGRLRRIWKWGAAEELIPASVFHGLTTLSGLKKGRTEAHETPGVQPVPDAVVDATLPHMTPTLAGMVAIQRLTGMRPGEVCMMKPAGLDMSGSIWVYKPETHKGQHHGRTRLIFIGPKGQDILRPFLRTSVREYLFQPIQSEDERRAMIHEARETPLSCGNKPGSNRKRHPKWGPNERYSADTYRKAINYACRRAFRPPDYIKDSDLMTWHREHSWSPNQLRHAYATKVRRDFGLEASQVLLGHAQADVTQIYAERDQGKALQVARQIG